MVVIDQVRWFQEQGADVTIAVADLEANATRGYSLAECRKIALEEHRIELCSHGSGPGADEYLLPEHKTHRSTHGIYFGQANQLV